MVEANDYISVESVDKNYVYLNCTKLVTNRTASVALTVDVTDSLGNVLNAVGTVVINNPITDFYIEGKDLDTNPKITTKVAQGDDNIYTVTAGEGTDDWYVYSVSSSNSKVAATKKSNYTFNLVCNDTEEQTSTISLAIQYRNRSGVKNYTFTWNAILEYDNLCFTSIGDSTVALQPLNSGTIRGAVANLFISKNGGEWIEWDYSAVSLADGEKLEVYGTEFRNCGIYSDGYQFILQGKIKVSGDLVALNNGSSVMNSYQYASLFTKSVGLYDAANLVLPKKVGGDCYNSMFQLCTSLVNVPKLPAMTLAASCYEGMFYGCTALTKAPDLPATTLASQCYKSMFSNCDALIEAMDIIPATTLGNDCCNMMFYKCTSLTKAPQLPATTLYNSCYSYMFSGCTSLENAPVLPAIKLVTSCYSSMFYGCSKLNYVKALFTDNSATRCTSRWLEGVASSGTFVKNAAATWNVVGASGVPEGWTVQTITV